MDRMNEALHAVERVQNGNAEDEYYLPTQLFREVYQARIQIHRSESISERGFAAIRRMGMNAVRIPAPYFIFGDRPSFLGCIGELDKAFSWAEKYHLKILIDLHTVPMSQNGFDNGGLSGVRRWFQFPDEVEFVLNLLEKLAQRCGLRKDFLGIEPLNEPVTGEMWEQMDVEHRYPAADKALAEGSGSFYWSYKLLLDTLNEPNWIGWDSWDAGKCADLGWLPIRG